MAFCLFSGDPRGGGPVAQGPAAAVSEFFTVSNTGPGAKWLMSLISLNLSNLAWNLHRYHQTGNGRDAGTENQTLEVMTC
jgi:hypothetical protein